MVRADCARAAAQLAEDRPGARAATRAHAVRAGPLCRNLLVPQSICSEQVTFESHAMFVITAEGALNNSSGDPSVLLQAHGFQDYAKVVAQAIAPRALHHTPMHDGLRSVFRREEGAWVWLTCRECFLPSAASRKLSVTTVRTSAPLTASEASAQRPRKSGMRLISLK